MADLLTHIERSHLAQLHRDYERARNSGQADATELALDALEQEERRTDRNPA